MFLNETHLEGTVNQRVLGSSPREGAEIRKAIRNDSLFWF